MVGPAMASIPGTQFDDRASAGVIITHPNRGKPVLLLIFALAAGPGWFARDKSGFAQPELGAGLLGVLTLLIVPLQMLLVAFAMRGFQQGWNVELGRRDPSADPGLFAGPAQPA